MGNEVVSLAGTVLQGVVVVGLALTFWLFPKYLVKRVTEEARGAVDLSVGRTLAEHRHALDRQLEEHRSALAVQAEGAKYAAVLQQERFARDYGLFAQRRNEVYAETYTKFEEARGAFGSHFASVTESREFKGSPEPDLRDVAKRLDLITPAERSELNALLDGGSIRAAGELATALYARDGLRRAMGLFQEFRNSTVLHSLYFSSKVTSTLGESVSALVPLVVFAEEMERGLQLQRDERRKAAELMEKLGGLAARLRETMREEMQAAFGGQQASG